MTIKKNIWRTVAIIFIALAVLEAIILIIWWNTGTKYMENENKCAYDICGFSSITGESPEFDAYLYDDVVDICYCYKDGEVVKQEYLK